MKNLTISRPLIEDKIVSEGVLGCVENFNLCRVKFCYKFLVQVRKFKVRKVVQTQLGCRLQTVMHFRFEMQVLLVVHIQFNGEIII